MDKKLRIAWGITGAGDRIKETFDVMKNIKRNHPVEIKVFASKAGEQVLKWYKMVDDVKNSFDGYRVEVNANSPFLAGSIQTGKYSCLVIAPATANTIAKISMGIADTLLCNSALMALKAYVPVIVMPSDYEEGEVITDLPDGKKLRLRIRKEDVDHVEKLKMIDGILVVTEPEEIERKIAEILKSRLNEE
ncbi:archaeoflavoprotein AfpA [Geoglobus acetivorans]|uniref:Flavoprotein n=1 Tax=Geoglobus acetivorans TaxID=565033 RepID=A0A0A7GIF7_GEOAI|nr:flavoprotein [Geoglobus acetivorans]